MKKFRKLLLFAAITALLTCLLCVALSATQYSGNCGKNGNNVTWSLDTETGVLKIEGEGEMADYSAFYAPWYKYASSINIVDFGNGITSVGDYAFYCCGSLTNISIPDSVTNIGEYAFEFCKSLGYNEYDNAQYLGNEENPYFALISATNMYITSCTINEDTKVIAARAFYKCGNLTGIKFGNETFGNSSKLEIIGEYAFSNCDSLASVTIPQGVKSIGKMAFFYCNALNAVYITDIDAWCQIEFSDYFANPLFSAKKLYWYGMLVTEVNISNSIVKIGDYAFSNCDSLTSVTIPNSVTSIGDGAFSYCDSLTSVTIPNSVTSIGDDAFDFSNLTCINVDEANLNYKSEGGVLFSKDGTKLIKYPKNRDGESYIVPDGVVIIMDSSFKNCSNLSSVTISDSVTSIEKHAFLACRIEKIIFGNNSQLVSIGESAFQSCGNLRSIKIPSNMARIEDRAFLVCKNLTSVIFDENSQMTNIGGHAFDGCSGLANITIPSSVISIRYGAFSSCEKLTSITILSINVTIADSAAIPATATIYGYAGSTSETYATKYGRTFIGIIANGKCGENLTWMLDKNWLLTISGIGEMEDYNSKAAWSTFAKYIKSVVITDGVTNIGNYAFQNCSNLMSITIPDSVTSIGSYAFSGCSSLASIAIPSNITSIGNSAFDNCGSLIYNEYDNAKYLGNTENPYLALVEAKDTSVARCTINGKTKVIAGGAFNGCSSLASVTIFSKDVTIYDYKDTIFDAATIYGYSGSTAEAYATKYNRKFVAIDKYDSMNANATLNENITMNFIGTAITKEDVDGNDFKMTFVMNGSKTSVSPVEKNGKYTFPFAGIAPQCMNDEISYEMTMNGAVVKQGSISVSGYLKQLIEKKPANMTDAKFKAMSTLVSDMLNYGSAAQAYTGHGTDSLLNENYYDDIVNKYTELESTDKALEGAAPAGAKFTNVGVRFDNVNKVFFRFTADDISNVIITINGVAYGQDKFVKTGDKYTVYSEDILASKFDTVYTAILTYIGTDEKQMMTYSVKSFAYSFQNKRGEDGKLTAEAVLARATYTYGVSARAYENAE